MEALFINETRKPLRMGKAGMGKTWTPYTKRKDQCEKWVQRWSKKGHQGCEHKGINGEPAQGSNKGTNPHPLLSASIFKQVTDQTSRSQQAVDIYALAHLVD